MGTTLTGTTPQDTYDSLIKVTDNGPLSGSLKTLTDGLGNDSALALSTGAASVTGALSVSLDGLFGGSTNAGNAGTNTLSVGVAGTTAGGLQLWAANNQTHFIQFGDGTSGAQVYAGLIGYAHSDDALYFGSAATERMRINSAGNVGIGTSSPTTTLDVAGTGRIKSSVGDYLLTIENIQDDSQGLLVRASDNDSLPILKLQSSVGATSETWVDRFVVNKDGNVGIGTSSPASPLTIQPANDAANTLRIYRGKDGGFLSQSAIIDAVNGNVNIKSVATDSARSISFQLSSNGGSSYTQAARIDFDGLKFGSDSAAANALDDYEEGTFTANLLGSTTNPTTPASVTAYYTKIGRQATVNIRFDNVDLTGCTGDLYIAGLPFTSASGMVSFTGALSTFNIDFNGGTTAELHLASGDSNAYLYSSLTNAGWRAMDSSSSNAYLQGTITYFV